MSHQPGTCLDRHGPFVDHCSAALLQQAAGSSMVVPRKLLRRASAVFLAVASFLAAAAADEPQQVRMLSAALPQNGSPCHIEADILWFAQAVGYQRDASCTFARAIIAVASGPAAGQAAQHHHTFKCMPVTSTLFHELMFVVESLTEFQYAARWSCGSARQRRIAAGCIPAASVVIILNSEGRCQH